MRLKAVAEIYIMHSFAQLCNLNFYFRIFLYPDGSHKNGAKECIFVDLGESFRTHIYLQNLVSTQPRTSPVKFARSSGAAAKLLRAGAGPRERLAQRAVQDHKKTLLVLIAMLPIDSNLLGSEIKYTNTMRNMKIQKLVFKILND